jgi:nucleoid DNA-binding protein
MDIMTIMYRKKRVSKFAVGIRQLGLELAARTGINTHEVNGVIHAMREIIINHLAAGREVAIENLGTWRWRYRKGRTTTWANHIRSGKDVTSIQKDRWCVMFQPSNLLKKVATHVCEEPPKIGSNTGFGLDGPPQRIDPPKPNHGSPTQPLPEPSIRIPIRTAPAPQPPTHPAGSPDGTANSTD